MSVVVEMISDDVGDLRVKRMTMHRVPSPQEEIRVLSTVRGITTAVYFKVVRVVHNANTDEYPRCDGELDAWVHVVKLARDFRDA